MTPTQLRAYSAVARHGSVKAAAVLTFTPGRLRLASREAELFRLHALMFWVSMLRQDLVVRRLPLRLKLAYTTAGVSIYVGTSAAMFRKRQPYES